MINHTGTWSSCFSVVSCRDIREAFADATHLKQLPVLFHQYHLQTLWITPDSFQAYQFHDRLCYRYLPCLWDCCVGHEWFQKDLRCPASMFKSQWPSSSIASPIRFKSIFSLRSCVQWDSTIFQAFLNGSHVNRALSGSFP